MDTNNPYRLFLDCSGPGVKLGIICNGTWSSYLQVQGSALETLFDPVSQLLKNQGLELSDLGGVWFCEGPGSLLSLRVGAMAVQSWYLTTPFPVQPQVFPLMKTAAYLLLAEQPDFLLVAPGRKGEWHQIVFRDRRPIGDAATVNTANIQWDPEYPAYWIPHRNLGQDLPGEFQRWEPDWSQAHPSMWEKHSLLTPANPQALLPENHTSSYQRWSGAIHQK